MSRSPLRGKATVTSAAFVALGALMAGGLTALPAQAAPADKYAVSLTGAVSRTIGSAASQILISEGNVRVPS